MSYPTGRIKPGGVSDRMLSEHCSCRDGHGAGQASKQPLIAGKCVARETLTALKRMTSPTLFHQITWQNGMKLIKISS